MKSWSALPHHAVHLVLDPSVVHAGHRHLHPLPGCHAEVVTRCPAVQPSYTGLQFSHRMHYLAHILQFCHPACLDLDLVVYDTSHLGRHLMVLMRSLSWVEEELLLSANRLW